MARPSACWRVRVRTSSPGYTRAFAQKLLEPNDPLVRPDPNAAYELMAQARELAESPALCARRSCSRWAASA